MKRKKYVLLVVLTIISVVFVGCGEDYSEELDQLNAEVARLQVDLDELQKANADNTTTISINVGSIKTLQTGLEEIQTTIDDSYNADNVDTITTNTGSIEELQDEIDDLQGTDTENATAISTNAASIEQIQADLNDIQGRIDTLNGSYNAGELDQIWISIEEIQTELDTIESGNAGGASVSIEITKTGDDGAEWEQNYSEFLDGWSDLVKVWYTIRNTGSIDIDYYKIWFTATCTDETTYEDWTMGSGLDTGHSITGSTFISVPNKEVASVKVTDHELTVW